MTRKLPETASVAVPDEGGKLFAPSAARNAGSICDLIKAVAPPSGRALELASGTGQHVAALAARLPHLLWQPTEIDAARRASIDAHAAETGLGNIAPAIALDACTTGWAETLPGQELILLVNLLHLIVVPDMQTLIAEAAQALAPGGRFVIYGPFLRAGALTSDGDAAFHASLVAQDPAIGYKDDFDVMDLLEAAGLRMNQVVEMPANNLALIAEKPRI